MSAGLIVNPLSAKGNVRGRRLAGMLADTADVEICLLDDFGKLDGFLQRLAGMNAETIFISSGDGTIQEIQTRLAEGGPFETLPKLCLLPHGTTNMTAADLGFRDKSVERQAGFIAAHAGTGVASELRRRHTLRIANPAGGKPRHGMFTGTGAVWRATEFCQQAVHRTGLKGDFATFATLALSLGRALLTPGNPQDRERIDRPYPMTVTTADGEIASGGELMLLATTLDKLILGARPFWGGKSAPVRASIFPYPPPNLVRWVYPTLYGREDRRMPDGCHSFSADWIEIATDCPFVLDGEFFDPPAGVPLRIESGPELTYVCR